MTTEQDLLAAAAQHARSSKVPLKEWIRRVHVHDAYLWRNTAWGKALLALEAVKNLPTPAPSSGRGQRVVYFSNITDEACAHFAALGPAYTARVTADPNPLYAITDAQIAKLKEGGGRVESWCDCRNVLPPTARAMAWNRGLDGWSGEFETNPAWAEIVSEEATDAIGNPNALSPQNLAEAKFFSANGSMRLIGEVMQPDPAYSAQGVNITSACYYVDRDAKDGGYLPLQAYEVMPTTQRATCSVYGGARMEAADWATFKAWTKP